MVGIVRSQTKGANVKRASGFQAGVGAVSVFGGTPPAVRYRILSMYLRSTGTVGSGNETCAITKTAAAGGDMIFFADLNREPHDSKTWYLAEPMEFPANQDLGVEMFAGSSGVNGEVIYEELP